MPICNLKLQTSDSSLVKKFGIIQQFLIGLETPYAKIIGIGIRFNNRYIGISIISKSKIGILVHPQLVHPKSVSLHQLHWHRDSLHQSIGIGTRRNNYVALLNYKTVTGKSTSTSVSPPALVISPFLTPLAVLLGKCLNVMRKVPVPVFTVFNSVVNPIGLPLVSASV